MTMPSAENMAEPAPTCAGRRPARIIQVACVDLALKNLLLPLMIELRRQGLEVEAAAADLGKGAADYVRSSGFVFHDIRMKRNLSPANIVRSFITLYRLFKRGRYDAVHLHTPIAAFIGRFAAKAAKVPLILYTAHGFYFHENMHPVKRLFFESLEFMAGRAATDFLFCQSIEDANKAVSSRFLDPSSILYIGNGVDIERFRPDSALSSLVRKELRIPLDAGVIVFMGRLVREKGILDLMKVFTALADEFPETVLLIVGDSEAARDRDSMTVDRLKTLVGMSGLGDRIKMLGFRDDPERIMAAGDIFVLPSYREGLPRSICEAMASGLPVIATKIRGCREQVLEGETGFLFEPGDLQELELLLGGLLRKRGTRILMGGKARETAADNHDETSVLKRQIVIFRHLLGLNESEDELQRLDKTVETETV